MKMEIKKLFSTLDMDTVVSRARIEEQSEWLQWIEKIPYIQFPAHWFVKVIPPFAGAMARFWVHKIEGHYG